MAHLRRWCTIMNNEEKNTYAKKQITNAIIALLSQYDLIDISISQITKTAQVSRNSFYRNYNDKEDILYQYIKLLLATWHNEYHIQSKESNVELYASLFEHIIEYKDVYLLLNKRNLFHLVLNALLDIFGPKSELDNMWAYTSSFITYGTFGWIVEWMNRGMQESAEKMATLLVANGMK